MKTTSWIATALPSFLSRFHLAILTLASLMLLPEAYAVSPPPDGGYPGFNTAEGQNALLSLDVGTGFANTAVGSLSLQSNVDGSFNTGTGAGTLSFNTGNENTAVGAAALLLNTTGEGNTAIGAAALLNNTIGEANTAMGENALSGNTIGFSNTATGALALSSNTEGNNNTANGSSALKSNTTGDANTANGVAALENNTEGALNTATGEVALTFNTTGSNNTANGVAALLNNIDGNSNTATGLSALHDNNSGSSNTADGDHALFSNVAGNGNTASGDSALNSNTEGNSNTAIGESALSSNTTGSINTALGLNAGSNLTTGDNNIDIGADVNGVAGESNTIRIGNPDITTTIIRGISGQTISSGAAVLVAANGQLGTATSSRRFKEDIKPMDNASRALFLLNPVTFHYKKEIDPARTQQFGLVAEEVEKINPDLVARDENGNVNTVRYDQVNAMLLNEFIKEHCLNEKQEATITYLRRQVESLTAGLQRVSAQLAAASPSDGGLELSKVRAQNTRLQTAFLQESAHDE